MYTINNESPHLYVYGVPSINLRAELKTLFQKYGQIIKIHVVQDAETEPFTECFHVQYQSIQSARIAKRFVDTKNFYGGVLHVCYAPEHESIEETKNKLAQRNKDVLRRLNSEGNSINQHEFIKAQNTGNCNNDITASACFNGQPLRSAIQYSDFQKPSTSKEEYSDPMLKPFFQVHQNESYTKLNNTNRRYQSNINTNKIDYNKDSCNLNSNKLVSSQGPCFESAYRNLGINIANSSGNNVRNRFTSQINTSNKNLYKNRMVITGRMLGNASEKEGIIENEGINRNESVVQNRGIIQNEIEVTNNINTISEQISVHNCIKTKDCAKRPNDTNQNENDTYNFTPTQVIKRIKLENEKKIIFKNNKNFKLI